MVGVSKGPGVQGSGFRVWEFGRALAKVCISWDKYYMSSGPTPEPRPRIPRLSGPAPELRPLTLDYRA